VNRGTNDVTVISDFTSSTPVFDTFSTGGIEPVAALGVMFAGATLESLIVANEGDGLITLLGGAQGLDEEAALSSRALPAPTALALASLSGDEVSFYATTAGMEAAYALTFILPGFTPAIGPVPGSSSDLSSAAGQLVALGPSSLALVGTLLVTELTTSPPASATVTVLNPPPGAGLAAATVNPVEVNTSYVSVPPSQGQAVLTRSSAGAREESEAEPSGSEGPVLQDANVPPWVRSMLGVEEMFHEIREENQPTPPAQDVPTPSAAPRRDDGNESPGPPLPRAAAPPANEPVLVLTLTFDVERTWPDGYRDRIRAVDQALAAFRSVPLPRFSWRPVDPPPPRVEPILPESAPTRPAPATAVSAWVLVLMGSSMVVRANRPGKPSQGLRNALVRGCGRASPSHPRVHRVGALGPGGFLLADEAADDDANGP
jgi:hypothetical protein